MACVETIPPHIPPEHWPTMMALPGPMMDSNWTCSASFYMDDGRSCYYYYCCRLMSCYNHFFLSKTSTQYSLETI